MAEREQGLGAIELELKGGDRMRLEGWVDASVVARIKPIAIGAKQHHAALTLDPAPLPDDIAMLKAMVIAAHRGGQTHRRPIRHRA